MVLRAKYSPREGEAGAAEGREAGGARGEGADQGRGVPGHRGFCR